MLNWIAINTTGNYRFWKKSHVSRRIMFVTACAQNVRLQQERKRTDAGVTLQQHV